MTGFDTQPENGQPLQGYSAPETDLAKVSNHPDKPYQSDTDTLAMMKRREV